jgi:hypothetical protein
MPLHVEQNILFGRHTMPVEFWGAEFVFHTLADLIDSSVFASDGIVGRVVDAYVDDRTWGIKYLLVSVAQAQGDHEMVCFPETITDVDSEGGGSIVADCLSPRDSAPASSDRNIRSAQEVLGCAVSGSNGLIGCTRDAIIETDSWVLRFLLIEGAGLCSGSLVLLQPSLINEVRWEEGSLHVGDAHSAVLCSDSGDAVVPALLSRSRRLH